MNILLYRIVSFTYGHVRMYVYTHAHTSFISLYLSTDTNFEDFVLCIGTSMFDIVKAWFKPTKKQHKNKFMQNVKLVIN